MEYLCCYGSEVNGDDYGADEEEASYVISDEKIWMWINNIKTLKKTFEPEINTSKPTLLKYYENYYGRFDGVRRFEYQYQFTREANLEYFTSLDKGDNDFWFFFTIPLVPTVYFVPYSVLADKLVRDRAATKYINKLKEENKKHVYLHLYMDEMVIGNLVLREIRFERDINFIKLTDNTQEKEFIKQYLRIDEEQGVNLNSIIIMFEDEYVYYNIRMYERSSFLAFVRKYGLKLGIKYNIILVNKPYGGLLNIDILDIHDITNSDIQSDFDRIPYLRNNPQLDIYPKQKKHLDNYKRCLALEECGIDQTIVSIIFKYL